MKLNFDWGVGWDWGGVGGRGLSEPMGTYHVHGKTRNSSWKIKWFAPFCLGTFRKHGLWFEAMQFFYSFKSVKYIWIYFVVDRFPTASVLQFYVCAEDFHLGGLCRCYIAPHIYVHCQLTACCLSSFVRYAVFYKNQASSFFLPQIITSNVSFLYLLLHNKFLPQWYDSGTFFWSFIIF